MPPAPTYDTYIRMAGALNATAGSDDSVSFGPLLPGDQVDGIEFYGDLDALITFAAPAKASFSVYAHTDARSASNAGIQNGRLLVSGQMPFKLDGNGTGATVYARLDYRFPFRFFATRREPYLGIFFTNPDNGATFDGTVWIALFRSRNQPQIPTG